MTTVVELRETAQRALIAAAEAAERATGFVRRRSKLTGSLFVQTLVFGWLARPEASLEELARTTAALGVRISPQGLDARFTREAAAFLRSVLEEAVRAKVAAEPAGIDVLSRFAGVYLFDGSQIALPPALADVWQGTGRERSPAGEDRPRAAIKLHVGIDLCRGRLLGPELTDGKESDRNADLLARVLEPGSIRIADRGYFNVAEIGRLRRQRVYVLTRMVAKTGFYDAAGRAWDLDAFLAAQSSPAVERPIELGLKERVPCRLVAVRVPPTVAEERRRRLRQRARQRGGTPSRKELTLCDWTVYVTTAPPDLLSLEEALALGRIRWQIELVFKLWKSQLKVDEWRSAKPWRILCELYAKLLGALLQHWILVTTGWNQPDRSAFKAAQVIRSCSRLLLSGLKRSDLWEDTLLAIRRTLEGGCRLNKRRKAPSSYQLLFNPQLMAA
jgi:hypothetical protein